MLLPIATLAVAALALTGCASPSAEPHPSPPASPPAAPVDDVAAFASLEEDYGARLGVYAIDTGSGREVAWRDDERFAYASTIKAMAAGALLESVGIEGLAASVQIDASAIVSHSPVTELRVGGTMTLGEVARAAMTVSDNTAANIMFEALGGSAALDASLTALGDETTVVSRTEPELNEATPGDDRDTTTPRAFARNLQEYLLGTALSEAEKAQLEEWLGATETGGTLVRANLPSNWIVGDKSGAAAYGTRNDLAVVRPPGKAPIIISIMSSRTEADAERDDRLIAAAAAAAISALGYAV